MKEEDAVVFNLNTTTVFPTVVGTFEFTSIFTTKLTNQLRIGSYVPFQHLAPLLTKLKVYQA